MREGRAAARPPARAARRRGKGGLGRATYDVRLTLPTCDIATCDGRKSKSRDVVRVSRMSNVARPPQNTRKID